MKKLPLGRTGLAVSPVCFGGNVFGWTLDRKASFAMLDRCLDAGLNFIDSADVYSAWVPGNSGGESETLIGAWMKDRGTRDRMVVATKCGMDMKAHRPNLKPDYVRACVDASLKRLQTDRIDLFYAHRDDPTVPLADVLGTFSELQQAGKIKAVGASNFSPARLTEAMAVHAQQGGARFDVLQNEYNLYDRRWEGELARTLARYDIAGAPYYALGSGFFSGKYRSAADAGKSPRGQAVVAKFLNPRGLRILEAMDAVAAETGASLSQIAIAWLIAKPTVASPIASATSAAQFADLVAAARLQLDEDQIRRLDAAGA